MILRGDKNKCKGEYKGFTVTIQQSKTGYYVKYFKDDISGLNYAIDIEPAASWAMSEIDKELRLKDRVVLDNNNDIPF